MRFFEFSDIEERKVDPVELANRVSRRYGKKTYYGDYENPQRSKHIPLTLYNRRLTNSFNKRYDSYLLSLGMFSDNKEKKSEAHNKFKKNQTVEKFNIKDLIPSQPFNRYNDIETTKEKIKDTTPKIHIVTYKGNKIISDGHHAVMAAKLRGEKSISADHTNLDVLYPAKNKSI